MQDAPPNAWLTIRRGAAPLLLCMPHTGTSIPPAVAATLASAWLARKDTDWRIERLYEFARAPRRERGAHRHLAHRD